MSRHERASTIVTTNRPIEDWGKVLGDAAASGARWALVYSFPGAEKEAVLPLPSYA